METDIVLPEKMDLHSFDFNVIVGNFLDNAIAASIHTDGQLLRFNMRMENGVLLLYMVNSCMGIPDGVCEIRRLSGKSYAGHGIGLTNCAFLHHGLYIWRAGRALRFRCGNDRRDCNLYIYYEVWIPNRYVALIAPFVLYESLWIALYQIIWLNPIFLLRGDDVGSYPLAAGVECVYIIIVSAIIMAGLVRRYRNG